MVIDPHGAKLQCFAGAHSLENICSPHRSGEAIYHIIGFPQYFLFSTEATYNYNRAKDFILYDLGIVAIFRDHCWLEEVAFLQSTNAGTLTAHHDICAIA